MKKLTGTYTDAVIYANVIEEGVVAQVQNLIDNPLSEGSVVRLMPDCHQGKGCTIGTTMTIKDKVCVNLVGVDIGCAVFCVKLIGLKQGDLNLEEVDKQIRQVVPLGFKTHDELPDSTILNQVDTILNSLTCKDAIKDKDRLRKSIGTLGGGNHYIELNVDEKENVYLVIHTGSRNLGQQVAIHHQKIAEAEMMKRYEKEKQEVMKQALMQDTLLIEDYLAKHRVKKPEKSELELAYLTGELLDNYLKDMALVQDYATLNRSTIASNIIHSLVCSQGGIYKVSFFQSVHNYIDLKHKILRKGAISAQKGEPVIIPLNMKDGSIIGVGKGNPDWNYSAPHGAGRVLGRKQAQKTLNVEDFQQEMKEAGVYSTSVSSKTLDEAPAVYKNPKDILDLIGEVVEDVRIIKPIYNLKG